MVRKGDGEKEEEKVGGDAGEGREGRPAKLPQPPSQPASYPHLPPPLEDTGPSLGSPSSESLRQGGWEERTSILGQCPSRTCERKPPPSQRQLPPQDGAHGPRGLLNLHARVPMFPWTLFLKAKLTEAFAKESVGVVVQNLPKTCFHIVFYF